MSTPTGEPRRADARRNRARLLAAAAELFAERGEAVSTEDVARHAGVAVGTVFRHFPTKQDLLTSILKERLAGLLDRARELASGDDPGGALFAFFETVVDEATADRAVIALLARTGVEVRLDVSLRPLRPDLARLLDLAQQAGTVRRGIRPDEVDALLTAACHGALHGGWDADLRQRTVAIVFQGLAPVESTDPWSPATRA